MRYLYIISFGTTIPRLFTSKIINTTIKERKV